MKKSHAVNVINRWFGITIQEVKLNFRLYLRQEASCLKYILFLLLISIILSCAPVQPLPVTQPDDTIAPVTESPGNGTTQAVKQVRAQWKADGVMSENEYDRMVSYDNGKYELAWAADNEYIYIFMRAMTEGFVALGIQPGTMMREADIIIGFVKDGRVSIRDDYSANAFGPHSADTDLTGGTDDIIEYFGVEKEEYTTLEFKRKLNTGDKYDHPVAGGINKIIWAYGFSDDFQIKHSSRGYGQIEL